MKKIASVLLISGILATGIASACPGGKGEKMVDRMVNRLELSSEQETQFREIMTANIDQMKSFHEQRRTDTLNQLSNVLDTQQLAEFEEMTERRFRHKKGI